VGLVEEQVFWAAGFEFDSETYFEAWELREDFWGSNFQSRTGATEQANAKRQLLLGEKDLAKFNQSSRESCMALSWGWDHDASNVADTAAQWRGPGQ